MKEKVNEILELCFKINGFEKRQREYTGEKPTIFIEFSGHVATLTIKVHGTGWRHYNRLEEYEKSFTEMTIYLLKPFEEIKQYIDECILFLKEIEKRCHDDEYLQEAV